MLREATQGIMWNNEQFLQNQTSGKPQEIKSERVLHAIKKWGGWLLNLKSILVPPRNMIKNMLHQTICIQNTIQ